MQTQSSQEEETITLKEESKVIAFSLDESDRLQIIGTILSTKKGRAIYSLLIDKEMHAREIAKIIENNQNPHLPGIKYHLIKMVKCGLISHECKLQRKGGKTLKYYRAIPVILISPKNYLKILKNNIHQELQNLEKFGITN